jgi:hypothetical protein
LQIKHLSIVPVLLLAACADGGTEDQPQSQVTVSASHHMFALRSLPGFGSLPIGESTVVTQNGLVNLIDDSTYTLTDATGTSRADRYAIEADGAFTIFSTGSATEPSTAFLGGYGLVVAPSATVSSDYFFTDRVSTPSSQRIGMFFGTRVITGQVELEGGWHLLSQHVIFGESFASPDSIGRAAHGGITITAGAPGTLRTISGTGLQTTSNVVFGGQIQNLLDTNDVGDGSVNLTVEYQVGGLTSDARVIEAAATENVVFGVDKNDGNGEAGFVVLIRKFDNPVDSVRVPGTFLVGGHTLFVNPSNAGSDAFVGTVTLTAAGAFRLDAVGSSGADFTYTGTYSLSTVLDGGMTINISGTNETWFGAIDRSYNTFSFVDEFLELRSNNQRELNFGFGVRKKVEDV